MPRLLRPSLAVALAAAVLALLPACGSQVGDKQADGATAGKQKTAADADGDWAVLRIDDAAVAPDSFRVVLRRGEVTGGHDGCNNWGYDESVPPLADGSRMIVSDAQACPETAQSRAYRMVIAKPAIRSAESGRLVLSAGGHRLLLERCQWVTIREERPGYSSVRQSCRFASQPRSA